MKNALLCSTTLLLSACADFKCDPALIKSGMSDKDLLEFCGKPNHVNHYGFGASSEQWIYGPRLYVYVSNGKVTGVQW